MKRKIITFGRYFNEFMEGLTAKEREKVDYGMGLLKTQDRLPAKFVKHIRDGLVLFNGFQKKKTKNTSWRDYKGTKD